MHIKTARSENAIRNSIMCIVVNRELRCRKSLAYDRSTVEIGRKTHMYILYKVQIYISYIDWAERAACDS